MMHPQAKRLRAALRAYVARTHARVTHIAVRTSTVERTREYRKERAYGDAGAYLVTASHAEAEAVAADLRRLEWGGLNAVVYGQTRTVFVHPEHAARF